MLDNFSCDPLTGSGMLQTAENVARKWQITTGEQNDVTLRRYEQYQDALARRVELSEALHDAALRRAGQGFKRKESKISGDEGVYATTAEGVRKLKPVMQDGTVTFAGQTPSCRRQRRDGRDHQRSRGELSSVRNSPSVLSRSASRARSPR